MSYQNKKGKIQKREKFHNCSFDDFLRVKIPLIPFSLIKSSCKTADGMPRYCWKRNAKNSWAEINKYSRFRQHGYFSMLQRRAVSLIFGSAACVIRGISKALLCVVRYKGG